MSWLSSDLHLICGTQTCLHSKLIFQIYSRWTKTAVLSPKSSYKRSSMSWWTSLRRRMIETRRFWTFITRLIWRSSCTWLFQIRGWLCSSWSTTAIWRWSTKWKQVSGSASISVWGLGVHYGLSYASMVLWIRVKGK